jgi:hypothetical protein
MTPFRNDLPQDTPPPVEPLLCPILSAMPALDGYGEQVVMYGTPLLATKCWGKRCGMYYMCRNLPRTATE